jgi:hypothetical protein
MGAGYGFQVFALPASLILPGDFTSRGPLSEAVGLALLSIQWAAAGALIAWVLYRVMLWLRPSLPRAI